MHIKCPETVVEGLKFKSFALSVPSVWVNNPEMYAHLKPAKCARTKDTKLPVQLLTPKMAKPVKAAGKEETHEGNLKKILNTVATSLITPSWGINAPSKSLSSSLSGSPPSQ
ncbi:hypothetical protein DSO57_1022743 [Entomophthora muscae]|uniref:Uncharacterized protein n=1 Tax=Entomophthora muscae TaxID=34485 RepID=A0ACC2RU64_9FUNG|nr:hypothetical protein DSO57_1022743 [Entomophthora muscae]